MTYRAAGNVLRMYNYTMANGQSLIILNQAGDFYHTIDETTTYGPILSIPGCEDFAFISWNGRAYISPIERTTTTQGTTREVGMQNEVIYVYDGDGSSARPAAGEAPSGANNEPLTAYNSSIDGVIDQGIHILAVTFSDGVDDSTALGPTVLPLIYAPGGKQAYLQYIPIGEAGTTERRIWMTPAIKPVDYDPAATYTFYLAKTILDNTTISDIVDIADIDLVVAFVPGTLPNPTSGGIRIENTANEGFCDIGLHIIGVVYETASGYLTAPGPEFLGVQTFVNENRAINITNIPVSPSTFVTKRHLVASKAVVNYNGDDLGYQLFFIPNGTLNNNTTTSLEVSFYDIDLLDDASHLLDNFATIPAGAVLSSYNNRLIVGATFSDVSILYLSAPGEPEAIDQVDGIVIVPLDGNPITAAQEFRDVLYAFKQTRTYAINDNGDVPSTWSAPVPIDQGIGSSVHGIATVLDSGGVNIDYLLIVDYSGLMVFNGGYQRPELTWKVQDFWLALDRLFFGFIQIMNDSVNQRIYITLPSKQMIYADYSNGLDHKNIRWWPWLFDIETTTIALMNTDTLFIGAEELA
jgi:hypothetical protein